ncbi:MAG: hypothetical protein WCF04_07515 [Candidatus Nanopelagicales bacterium]
MKRTFAAALAGVALTGLVGVGVAAAASGEGPAGRVAEVLEGLVSKGTITQGQADTIEKALEDARSEDKAEHQERREEQRAQMEALYKDVLGLTVDEVRTKLKDGTTLRKLAGDKADELASGFRKIITAEVEQAVADGDITQARADEILAALDERIENWLDGKGGPGVGLGLGRGHGGRHGGPGMGGYGGGSSSPTPDTGSSGSSTSGSSASAWSRTASI